MQMKSASLYEQAARHPSFLGNPIMRSRKLTPTILAIGLITGCEAGSNLTAENAHGLRADVADAADLRTPEHIKLVEQFTEALTNPCNGEVIVFSGEAITQITEVDGLHIELQGSASGTGTGPESGATYEYNLVFHENDKIPSVTKPQGNFFANANARVSSSLRELSFTSQA